LFLREGNTIMGEMLQELVDSRGVSVRVDPQEGVIRGVKILGLESRNGRSYRPEALSRAALLYEGAKVNVNHPKGAPTAPRDYQDRIGVIRNVAVRPEGLFGDFQFNPKHALAEQLVWDAEHAPENVGFSHNVEARTSRSGDGVVVEAILRVQSVDLVADPATTRGLFESVADSGAAALTPVPSPARGEGSGGPDGGKPAAPAWAELSIADLRRRRPDLVEAIVQEQAGTLAALRAEVDRLRAAEALRRKEVRARQLLEEYGLPDPDGADGRARSLVSPWFLESLLAAPDDEAMRAMVEDRAKLARLAGEWGLPGSRGTGRPISRDQCAVDRSTPADVMAFVEAIT
jgi:hypothetical protein